MIKGTISLKNMEGFDAQLEEVVSAIELNLEEVASYVEQDAKNTSSFIDRTGNLRRSIKKSKSKFEGGGYIVSASGKGGRKGHHAALVEYGHVMIVWGHPTGRRVPAHPFMRPAIEKGYRHAISLFRKGK